MPCLNHPEVVAGLDSCTRCAKTFCIDCLVGRKAGWFCAPCDKELGGPSSAQPAGGASEGKPAPAASPTKGKACRNHAEVLDGLNPCAACGFSFCPDCLVELKGRRFCAGCKVNAVKDIQSGVDGTGLQLAGIGARFCALLIDNFVTGAVMMVFFVILGVVVAVVRPGQDSVVLPLLVFAMYGLMFVGMFCYHGFMLQWKGQTLGKMAMKIKVVTPEGGPITPGQAWIRVLVWFLLHGCAITYLTVFFNPEKLTIHDMAARTRVVRIG
jgi:uncharacterized RDD family membrane protein YckC